MGLGSYVSRKMGRPFEHSFRLKAGGETRKYSWKLKKGESLVGEVTSDKKVWVYVLSISSLWDLQFESDFVPEWKAEGVCNASVSFKAPKTGRFHLLVTNEVGRDSGEEEFVMVRVRMRTER